MVDFIEQNLKRKISGNRVGEINKDILIASLKRNHLERSVKVIPFLLILASIFIIIISLN